MRLLLRLSPRATHERKLGDRFAWLPRIVDSSRDPNESYKYVIWLENYHTIDLRVERGMDFAQLMASAWGITWDDESAAAFRKRLEKTR